MKEKDEACPIIKYPVLMGGVWILGGGWVLGWDLLRNTKQFWNQANLCETAHLLLVFLIILKKKIVKAFYFYFDTCWNKRWLIGRPKKVTKVNLLSSSEAFQQLYSMAVLLRSEWGRMKCTFPLGCSFPMTLSADLYTLPRERERAISAALGAYFSLGLCLLLIIASS